MVPVTKYLGLKEPAYNDFKGLIKASIRVFAPVKGLSWPERTCRSILSFELVTSGLEKNSRLRRSSRRV